MSTTNFCKHLFLLHWVKIVFLWSTRFVDNMLTEYIQGVVIIAQYFWRHVLEERRMYYPEEFMEAEKISVDKTRF